MSQTDVSAIPVVSFVIITMDRRDELRGCLDNLARQTYPRQEVIVVDNGSSDDTRAMLARDYPTVKVVGLSRNVGVAAGRNRGARAAQGEILVFLDDDARLNQDDTGQRVLAYFRSAAKRVVIAFTILNAYTGAEDRKAIPRRDKRLIHEDYECSYFCGAGFAMRRSVFLELGGFWDVLIYSGEELDFSYRLLDRGYRLVHSRVIRVNHREVPDARPKGQWLYFNLRNRVWIAARNLPPWYVVSTCLMWWGYGLGLALTRRQLGDYWRGLVGALTGLPAAFRQRRPLSRETVREVRRLGGRLWY